MKIRYSAILIFNLVLIVNCSIQNPKLDVSETQSTEKNKSLLLLMIDYEIEKVQMYSELSINIIRDRDGNFPIFREGRSATDFGWDKLYFDDKTNIIFHGGIVWMGRGHIRFPENWTSSEQLVKAEKNSPTLNDKQVQYIKGGYYNPDFPTETIWNCIKDYKLVHEHYSKNNKIAVYFYTPSVGMGDPKTWKWLLFIWFFDNFCKR